MTETRGRTDKVRVKNGYFSVYLGSVTPFGTDVDWNQDTLWFSIDVGGAVQARLGMEKCCHLVALAQRHMPRMPKKFVRFCLRMS